MPVPKHRHSHSRKNKRRANWRLKVPTISVCSHCHQPKLPHRVCPNCGYYNDREVIAVKE